jgi:hypothetical protein
LKYETLISNPLLRFEIEAGFVIAPRELKETATPDPASAEYFIP